MEETREDQDCRVVILKSKAPGMFCAGADLKERLKQSAKETENFVIFLRKTFDDLYVLLFLHLHC